MAFTVRTTRRGVRVVVRIDGEIDLVTAPQLRRKLTRAIREQSPHVVVDLAGVGLCGSTGLTVLRTAGLRASARGGSLALAGPRPTVRKVLTVSGYTKIFPVYDDIEAAFQRRPVELRVSTAERPAAVQPGPVGVPMRRRLIRLAAPARRA